MLEAILLLFSMQPFDTSWIPGSKFNFIGFWIRFTICRKPCVVDHARANRLKGGLGIQISQVDAPYCNCGACVPLSLQANKLI